MSGPNPSLTSAQIAELFPFYIALDRALAVTSIGPMLARIAPELEVGRPLTACFTIERPAVPATFADLCGAARNLFLLRHKKNERLLLRGQLMVMADGDHLLFVGSPWATAIESMHALGLSIGDLALHDGTTDLLFLLQAKNATVTELDRLATALQDSQEELRRAKAAAESANLAKSDILATISHEIRTPMNAILGMTELALSSRTVGEQHEFLERVQANAEALLHLLEEVLDISKIEAGQLDIRAEPFDPAQVVEGVGEALGVRAATKGLELVLDVSPELPRLVRGDANRLRQVLVNLVGNAIKFTDHGFITVRASEVLPRGRVEPAAAHLRFEVQDTGRGIREEDRPHVFDKFYQGSGARMRRGGTGLGLPISRSLVELMGGQIAFDSPPVGGTRFWADLALPIIDATPSIPERSVCTHHAIALCESEPTARPVVRALAKAGFRVHLTASPEELLATCDASKIDLALISRGLVPLETLDQLRFEHPTCRLVSIGHLGAPPPDLPLDGRVVKPLGPRKVLEVVERLLGLGSSDLETGSIDLGLVAKHAASGHRVLLVEDNHDNQVIAERALVAAGFLVDVADDGRAALAALEREVYELVFMDLEMPELDGFQTAISIRAREAELRLDRVPIVAVTAHALETFRTRCLEAGMDDHLPKPITPRKLRTVAEKWIDPRPLVLCADDSPDIRELVRAYLARDGRFLVITARDGQEALDRFARRRFAAVLLDIEMPNIDGYTAATSIRAMARGKTVPLIALTGHDDAAAEQRCKNAGFSHYLAKPIRREALLAHLARIVGAAKNRD